MHYPKIKGPFERDKQTKKVIPGKWTCPEFETLLHTPWVFSEKIDGMNISLDIGDDGLVTIGGRTKNALIPAPLANKLVGCSQNIMGCVLECCEGGTSDGNWLRGATLFGEGYGPGIQKGACYRDDQDFILFDIRTKSGRWLDDAEINSVAKKLCLDTVRSAPHVCMLSTAITLFAEEDSASIYSTKTERCVAEGLVGRPVGGLLDKHGGRIIVKLKTRDLLGLDLEGVL